MNILTNVNTNGQLSQNMRDVNNNCDKLHCQAVETIYHWSNEYGVPKNRSNSSVPTLFILLRCKHPMDTHHSHGAKCGTGAFYLLRGRTSQHGKNYMSSVKKKHLQLAGSTNDM